MRNYTKTITLLMTACYLLLVSGCQDIMNPTRTPEQKQNQAGLRITVTSAETKARTLYPRAVFTKYVLEFDSAAGTHEPITLTNTDTTNVNNLANGTWTVKATGFVTINGTEYPAAEGEKTITVNSGQFQGLSINISAKNEEGGPRGHFSWLVNYPASVYDAKVYIYDVGGHYDYNWGDFGSVSYPVSNNAPRTVDLDPGYYMMSIRLAVGSPPDGDGDDNSRTITWTEVIHIYSNMETRAEKTFTEDDLTRMITMGGAVDIKINGQRTEWFSITVYIDENYSRWISDGRIDYESDRWDITLAGVELNTTVYLEVRGYDEGSYTSFQHRIGAVTLNANHKDVPIRLNFTTINMRCQVSIKVKGSTIAGIEPASVELYRDQNYIDLIDSTDRDSNWEGIWVTYAGDSMLVYPLVKFNAFNRSYTWDCGPVTVSGRNVPININLPWVILSGTANITMNGDRPNSTWVSMMDIESGEYLGEVQANSGNWKMAIPSFSVGTSVQISAYGKIGGDSRFDAASVTKTVSNADISGISLTGNPAGMIKLGGTIDLPNSVIWRGVEVYDDDGAWIGGCWEGTGTWGIWIRPLPAGTKLRFTISGAYNLNNEQSDFKFENIYTYTVPAGGGNISVNLSHGLGIIILSGTVRVNNSSPGEARVQVYLDGYAGEYCDVAPDGTWKIIMKPPAVLTYARVSVWGCDVDGDEYGNSLSAFVPLFDQSISGINFNITRVKVGGTFNITVDGEHPSYANVTMYRASDDQRLDSAYVSFDNGGNWKMVMDPFESSTDVYFVVEGSYYDPQSYQFRKTFATASLYRTSKTDINYSGNIIAKIKIGGKLTVNGSPPQLIRVYVSRDGDNVQVYKNTTFDNQGNWEMTIQSFDKLTDVKFYVEGIDSNGENFGEGGDGRFTVKLFESNKLDINFVLP